MEKNDAVPKNGREKLRGPKPTEMSNMAGVGRQIKLVDKHNVGSKTGQIVLRQVKRSTKSDEGPKACQIGVGKKW